MLKRPACWLLGSVLKTVLVIIHVYQHLTTSSLRDEEEEEESAVARPSLSNVGVQL